MQLRRSLRTTALIAALGTLATTACEAPAPQAEAGPPDYAAQLKPAFDTFIEVWNTGEYDRLDAVIAENFRRVAPDQNANGREELKQFMQQVRAAYPDLRITIGEALYGKDLSFNQWTVTGTATLDDGSTAPIEVQGVTMLRYMDSKIAEEWVYFDSAALTSQLGVAAMPHAR